MPFLEISWLITDGILIAPVLAMFDIIGDLSISYSTRSGVEVSLANSHRVVRYAPDTGGRPEAE